MTQWEGKLNLHSKREIEKDGIKYYVEPLHRVASLTEECCFLINLEWKRSLVARMRSIENSSENFPMSLVLLRKDKPKVVGHCKISKLPFSDSKVFVETVVIHPDLRGKGLGKFLMEECEETCRRKKIKWIYLSTRGQEVFYKKLGYSNCSFCPFGNQLNSSDENIYENKEHLKESSTKIEQKNFCNNTKGLPPPPPPPLPLISNTSTTTSANSKTFMKKEIVQ